jgi:Homeodomain-like domain
MDRKTLEGYLRQELSLAEIATLVGRDPSTVGYWIRKHGLSAVHAQRHAPKGPIPVDTLTALVEEGLSIREVAARLGRSQGTVKHWLRRYGLKTRHQAPGARIKGTRGEDPGRTTMTCIHHGDTEFWLESRGIYRCLKCRSEAVSRRRRCLKEILVAEAGGRCAICGYDRHSGALQFHHRERSVKSFGLAERGFTRSLQEVRAEAKKCVLLCSNCHAEVEADMVRLP